MSVIDKSTFNELKQMSGEDFINELIDAFLDDGPDMISNMRAALPIKDIESFRRNAHSMKSNASTFGAVELSALARELELLARENNMDIGDRLEMLDQFFAKAAAELQGLRA